MSARRLDIQGLRAVAVLLVVAFHAGLPVPGGFIGVDIFFAISGFVITSMLLRELSSSGHINFTQFYLRRFKRLIPALALTVSITIVLSAILLSPLGSQQRAAQTGLGAMVFVANFVIERTTGGYFDAPAESNPLLNTWSLSIEEQFYFIFPALIAFGWYLARRTGTFRSINLMIIGGLGAVSFFIAMANGIGLMPNSLAPIFGFYSPVTRVWEFATGALLALSLEKRISAGPTRSNTAMGFAGVVMLFAALLLITDKTAFPGPWTILPITGTVLLLYIGTDKSNKITRSLSITPLVKFGDWSYSIYLWHWPMIVFATYIWPTSRLAPILAALTAMIPALAQYRWIEQPLRNHQPQTVFRLTSLIAGVFLLPILLATVVGFSASRYWVPRYESGKMAAIYEGDTDWTEFYPYLERTFYPCSNKNTRNIALKWNDILRCSQSRPESDVDVALVGDSHAEHLFLGFAEAFPDTNVAFYILAALPIEDGAGMSKIIQTVASDPSIHTVILNAAWAGRGAPTTELIATLESFVVNDKSVFVTDDVPTYPFHAYECKYGKSPFLRISNCEQKIDRFREKYLHYLPNLETAVESVPGVELLISTRYFCNEKNCSMLNKNQLLYRDSNHLNNLGSRYLSARLIQDNPLLREAFETE